MAHYHRLQRDLRELAAHNFDCSASNVFIHTDGNLTQIQICIRDGPFAQAHYTFEIHSTEQFPFKCPQIVSTVPVWHPNIELQTGAVTLPIEWTPDLRLVDLAVNLQLLMLNPSDLAVSNVEASLTYQSDPALFRNQIQLTLLGGTYSGMDFPPIINHCSCCQKTIISRNSDQNNSNKAVKVFRSLATDAHTILSCNSSEVAESLSPKGGKRRRQSEISVVFDDERRMELNEPRTASFKQKRVRLGVAEKLTPLLIPKIVLKNGMSWDTCSSAHEMISQADDERSNRDEIDDMGSLISSEWVDANDYDMYNKLNNPQYRSFISKRSDIESLPILRHLPSISRQIARSTSTDEYDGSEQSPSHARSGSIFRRSSVFAHNSGGESSI